MNLNDLLDLREHVIVNKSQLEQIIHDAAIRAAQETVSRYVVAHPRPSAVTAIQAAEIMGRGYSTVTLYIRRGTLKRNAAGMIPIEQIDKMISAGW